jgi:hypothetical protein
VSIFRELFVEVPQALLEAAVIEAQQREAPAAKLSLVHPDVWIIIFEQAQSRHNWKLIGWYRAEDDDRVVVRVRLECGHIGWFAVDEWKLASCVFSKYELLDYLLARIDEGPQHRCTCGTPQGLGPAGRPL